MFLQYCGAKQFVRELKILTEGDFINGLSSDAGISVGLIVWVMTERVIVSDIWRYRYSSACFEGRPVIFRKSITWVRYFVNCLLIHGHE